MKGGELLFVGLAGARPRAGERRLLRRLQPGGVVLFARNVEDEAQLTALVAELRALCPGAVVAMDAEGGRVDRLRELAGPAPAGEVLARLPARISARAGRWMGAALAHFGFRLDLAPVVDLDRGRRDNALDGRCLGTQPRAVTSRARAFLLGLHAAGVGGCLKHFPGLGGASRDTHRDAAPIMLGERDLARDLSPFRALRDEADAVMAAHAAYPALDPSSAPATLSPALARRLLRREVGYRGALLSDDLEMGALAPLGDLPELAEAALAAGCDGLLVCSRLAAGPGIAERLAASPFAVRRAEAGSRLRRLARRLARLRAQAPPPPSLEKIRAGLRALADSSAND